MRYLAIRQTAKLEMMKSCFPWPALVLQKPPIAARPGWGLAYHWRMLLGWPLVDSRSRYSKPGELLAYSLKGPAISMHSYFRLQTSCWNDWQMSSDAALAMDALYNPFFLFGHQLGTLPVVVCIEAVEGSETIIPHGSTWFNWPGIRYAKLPVLLRLQLSHWGGRFIHPFWHWSERPDRSYRVFAPSLSRGICPGQAIHVCHGVM